MLGHEQSTIVGKQKQLATVACCCKKGPGYESLGDSFVKEIMPHSPQSRLASALLTPSIDCIVWRQFKLQQK